jgi:hypothetical protein
MQATAPEPQEPLLHTFLTDCLPDDHPWARTRVRCVQCDKVVHDVPNEVMDDWVETGIGPVCFTCFARHMRGNKGELFALPYDYTPAVTPPTKADRDAQLSR